jgi:hypothetical protein
VKLVIVHVDRLAQFEGSTLQWIREGLASG